MNPYVIPAKLLLMIAEWEAGDASLMADIPPHGWRKKLAKGLQKEPSLQIGCSSLSHSTLAVWLFPEGAHLLSGLGHHVLALAAHAAEAGHLCAAGALVASQARSNGMRVLFSHVAWA